MALGNAISVCQGSESAMPPGARISQHHHIGHHNIDQRESYFRKDSLDFISRSRRMVVATVGASNEEKAFSTGGMELWSPP